MTPGPPMAGAAAGFWLAALWRASWQGGLLLACVWIAARAFPRIPASLRAGLWRLAYLKLALALLWAGFVTVAVLPPATHQPEAVQPATDACPAPRTGEPMLRPGALLQRTEPVARTLRSEPVTIPRRASALDTTWLLALLWLAGFLLSLARLAAQYRRVRSLRRACETLQDERCQALLRELGGHRGLRRLPELVTGPVRMAQLTGVLHPLLVLPPDLAETLPPAELRLVLAHELAHFQRHDLAWGWFFAVVDALFFFHPLLWLTRRDRRLAVELACDESALRTTEARPGEYGALLVHLAAQRREISLGFGTLHVLEPFPHLERRLALLKYVHPRPARSPLRTGSAIALLALGLLIPWRLTAQPVRASTVLPRPSAQPPAEAPQSVGVPAAGDPSPQSYAAPVAAASPSSAEPATALPAPVEAHPSTGPVRETLPVAADPAPAPKRADKKEGKAAVGEPQAARPAAIPVRAEAEEDALLLEAARYLRLSTSQLQALLPLARSAEARVSRLNEEEGKLSEALQRLATKRRAALLKGAPESSQDEADAVSLRQILQRKRAEAEGEVLQAVLPKLSTLFSPTQVEREYLLQRGQKPEGEIAHPTLLDPQAGFVMPAPAETREDRDLRVLRHANGQDGAPVAAAPPALGEQLPRTAATVKSLRAQLEQIAELQNANLIFSQESDGAYLKVGTPQGQRIVLKFPASTEEGVVRGHFQMMQDKQRADLQARLSTADARLTTLRRDVSAGAAESHFTSDEAVEILRPLARRLFLSPRFRPVLEERLGTR